MSVGRIIGTCVATVTVAGCAAVVVGMAHADPQQRTAAREPRPVATSRTRIPPQLPAARLPGRPAPTHRSTHRAMHRAISHTAVPSTIRTTTSVPPLSAAPLSTSRAAIPSPTATPRATRAPRTSAAPAPRPVTRTRVAPAPVRHTSAAVRGVRLPVAGSPGSATRVLTVKAAHSWSTTAALQAWRKAAGGGWLRVGPQVTAHVGADGLSRYPSESRSATPIGSFTLTQAFGYYANPGTSLRYFKTTGADWWISQSGPLYNTHQHCWSGCAFRQGSPNEHLMYETPYYNYAVVIDYNTRNSPTGVRQGAGSAFFLHVTDGRPTAGCVAIPQSRLVPIMRWLLPGTHPRIIIGT